MGDGDDTSMVTTVKMPRVVGGAAQVKTWKSVVSHLLPLVLLLPMACYLMAINFRQPWVSIHEDNGLVFMSSAVNNFRFGVAANKGETVVDTETLNANSPLGIPNVPATNEFNYLLTGPVHPYIYPDHPPLLSLTVTASLFVFGFHFWAVRLVPLAFSLGAIVLFYFLVAFLFDYGVAVFSTFLLATFPVMAYYGRNVAFEAEVVFWLLVMLTGYFRWEKSSKWYWLTTLGVGVLMGTLYDWPMVFFACILFVVDAASKRRIDLRLGVATIVVAAAACVLIIAQDFWALGGTLEPLVAVLKIRSGGTGYGGVPISIISWFNQYMMWNAQDFGSWSQLALPPAILLVVARAGKEGASPRIRFILITFLCGLANVVAFREGAFIHAYWQQYFLPFYAITIGWAAVEIVRRIVGDRRLYWMPLAAACLCVLALNLPTIVDLYSSKSGVFVPLLTLWK